MDTTHEAGSSGYPAYRFHITKGTVRVETAEADAALGEGWREHPYTEEELAMGEAAAAPEGDQTIGSEHPREFPRRQGR